MKSTRKAHLWIGLIASVLILLESITGLIMNEPWLIGQTQLEGGKGNFQEGQFNRGQFGQNGGQAPGQMQGHDGMNGNGQFQHQPPSGMQGQNGINGDSQFQRQRGFGSTGQAGFRGGIMGQGSIMGTIRGLHEGRLGNINIKWLIDLTAVAMIFLTGTGIYLSLKILRADKLRKKRQLENTSIL